MELYLDVDITKFTEENKVQHTGDSEMPINTCACICICMGMDLYCKKLKPPLNEFLFGLSFSVQQEQLIRKLAVILDVQDEDIIVEHLKEAGVGHR